MSKMPEWLGAARCLDCDKPIEECGCHGAGAVEGTDAPPAQEEEKDDAMGKVTPIKTAAATNEIQYVHGIEESKLEPAAIGLAIAKLKLKVSKKATLPELVLALKEHFAKAKQAVSPCDQCGGVSTMHDFDACPFCGDHDESDQVADNPGDGKNENEDGGEVEAPEETGTRALVHESTVEAVAELVPAGDLDFAVSEIRELQRNARINIFLIGRKLNEIGVNEIWKSRKTPDGKTAYTKLEDFARAELGMGRKYAQDLQRIAHAFSEDEARQIGPTKMRLVISIDDKELQQELLDKLRSNPEVGRRELEQQAGRKGIHSQTPGRDKKKAKKALARGKLAPTNAITVAAVEGKHMVRLYKRPAHRTEERVPAKQIADVPYGVWELVNDVRVYIHIGRNAAGELIAKLDVKRIVPGE